jgi:hypothetical protein
MTQRALRRRSLSVPSLSCLRLSPRALTVGVDPVRRTSWLCRVSGVGVADLVLVGGGRAIAKR